MAIKNENLNDAIQAATRFINLATRLQGLQGSIASGLCMVTARECADACKAVRRASLDVTQAMKHMRTDRQG